jgi:hypothetical protein
MSCRASRYQGEKKQLAKSHSIPPQRNSRGASSFRSLRQVHHPCAVRSDSKCTTRTPPDFRASRAGEVIVVAQMAILAGRSIRTCAMPFSDGTGWRASNAENCAPAVPRPKPVRLSSAAATCDLAFRCSSNTLSIAGTESATGRVGIFKVQSSFFRGLSTSPKAAPIMSEPYHG